MKKETADRAAILINLSVDIAIGYSIGHQFHSFAIGFAVYSVLSALTSINIKLSRRP